MDSLDLSTGLREISRGEGSSMLYALTPAPQLPRTLAVAGPGYEVPRTARVVRHALGGLQPAAAPAHGPIRGQYSDK